MPLLKLVQLSFLNLKRLHFMDFNRLIRFSLLFLGVIFTKAATAQTELAKSPHNLVKFNPFSLAAGQLSLFYERSLTQRTSLVLGYGFGNTDNYFGRLQPGGAVYQRATLEVRQYMPQHGIKGFYWGPYLRLSRLTARNFILDQQGVALTNSEGVRLTTNQQTFIWIPGGMVGFQTMNKWIAVDIFFGLQRQFPRNPRISSNQVAEAMTDNKWAPRFGLCVGFPF